VGRAAGGNPAGEISARGSIAAAIAVALAPDGIRRTSCRTWLGRAEAAKRRFSDLPSRAETGGSTLAAIQRGHTPPSARRDRGIVVAVEIVFETHSLTEDNENGIATGWLPGRLSARGRALAAQLGIRYRDTDLAAVFVSDLRRAVETVQIAFADTPIAIHQDERLRECNYGDLNGCAIAVLTGLRSRHIDLPFPGGQSYRQVVTATASFLNDLKSRWDDSRVLVVAHSANKWALDCLLDGKELENLVGSPFEWKEGWVYVLDRSCSELSQTKQ